MATRYEQIILFGRSVGSGPTVYLASRLGRSIRPKSRLFLLENLVEDVQI